MTDVKNEQLDETIDRVAAELTAVPEAPGFSARLRDRLQQPHRRSAARGLLLASVAATVVLIGIVVLSRSSSQQRDETHRASVGTTPERPRETPVAPPASVSGTLVEAARSASTVPRDAERVSRGVAAVPVVPLLEMANDEAPALAVLSVDRLTVGDVELTPLDIAGLHISDIDIGEEPKEPF